MNEEEKAALFGAELDRLLAGRRPAGESCDPGAIRLASELAAADFSRDSRSREALRLRLAPPRRPGLAAQLLSRLRNRYALGAAAAACLALAALPFLRRAGFAPAGAAAEPPVQARVLPAPASAPVLPVPAVFSALPMPALSGEPLAEFPIKAGGGQPITLAEGRDEAYGRGGSAVIWETQSGTFVLERRSVAPEEIFEIRSI